MRNIVFTLGIGQVPGRSDLANAFDLLCFLTTDVRDRVADARPAHILVAFLLHLAEPDTALIEGINDSGIFVWVGQERSGCLRIHEEGGELG